jgi:CBS domain-containing protein
MRQIPHYKSYERGPVEFKSKIHKEEGSIMTVARKPVITIAPTTSVKEATQLMVKHGIRRLPITRPGTRKLQGMVRSRDIVDFFGGGEKHNIIKTRFGGNFFTAINEPVRSIMSEDFPTGNIYMSIDEASKILLRTGVGGMPILDGEGNIEGIASEKDFIPSVPATTGTSVSYYMVRHVMTVGPEQSIQEAARRITSWGIRRLPVVIGKTLVGIVTTMDIIKYFGTSKVFEHMRSQQMDDAMAVPVQEIMSKNVVKVAPETDVGEAAALMRDTGYGGLAVVLGSSLVGIITEHDLLRSLL